MRVIAKLKFNIDSAQYPEGYFKALTDEEVIATIMEDYFGVDLLTIVHDATITVTREEGEF